MSAQKPPQMKVESWPIDRVKPYDKNPRKIPSTAVNAVASSIQKFGWQQPIVVSKDGVIIVGHSRYLAARQLGFTEVPVHVAENLSDEEANAYRLADNKTNELSDWDDKKLNEELAKLGSFDMSQFGFDLSKALGGGGEGEGQIVFTKELLEENNYLVFVFNNVMDWQVVKEKFGITAVDGLDSKQGYTKKGVGRIIDGKVLLK